MPKLYDCFIFLNELDVLEWRLHELDELVDHFVVVEATRNFHGDEKPLVLRDALAAGRFAEFRDRIRLHTCETMPDTPLPDSRRMYETEGIQRDMMTEGLFDAADDDLVLVSDVDEIPKAHVVRECVENGQYPVVFEQMLFYYYLNLLYPHNPPWPGTRLMTVGAFRQFGGMRARIAEFPHLRFAGWHFSFFGGPEVMANKVRSWSHVEVNRTPMNTVEHMEEARRRGVDWDIGRNAPLRWLSDYEVFSLLPQHVWDNMERYVDHFGGEVGERLRAGEVIRGH